MKGRRQGRLVNWRKDTLSTDPKAVERRLKRAMAKLSVLESDRPAQKGDDGEDKSETGF
jgi:hypothetical protein